jgi:phosphoribosyl 1,2-cyclic phosphodiesterase
MKLTFIGTRAFIKHRTKRHWYNAACLVSYRSTTILIDCGIDWLDKVTKIRPRPHAIFITHAHPDHSFGLQGHVPCPVYATQQTIRLLKNFSQIQFRVTSLRQPVKIGGVTVQAFPVEHSINAPAVGYRITAGKKSIFYVPDLVSIRAPNKALKNVSAYIGDGARVMKSRVFRRGKKLFGHTAVATQVHWCQRLGVPQAIFTHCGTEIVTKPIATANKIRALGKKYGVKTVIACDRMVVKV